MSIQERIQKLKSPWPSILAWAICLSGTIFYAYEYILRIEPSIMHSQLQSYFNMAHAGSWGSLIGLYYLAYTPMQLPAGPITDYWGPRRVLTGALGLCVLGLFLFYITSYLWLAGIGRFLVGLGSAFAYIGASRLAVIWLPANRFALFSGLTIGAGMLGAISGNLLISNVIHHLGWRGTLDVTLYMGIVLLPAMWIIAQDEYHKYFAHQSLKLKSIIKQLFRILTYSQVWIAGIIACFLYVALSGFGELWGPITLQKLYHLSSDNAAEINSLIFWGALFGAPFAGWLSDFLSNRKTPLIVACCMCLILTLLIFYLPYPNHQWYISILLFFYGFFAGFEIIAFALGREYIGSRFAGTAVAFVNMLAMMSGLIYQPLIGWTIDFVSGLNSINQTEVHYTALDYQQAMSIIPFSLCLAILLCAFLLKETHAIPVDDEQTD